METIDLLKYKPPYSDASLYPIWFCNFTSFIDLNHKTEPMEERWEGHLGFMRMFSNLVIKWLDNTTVLGDSYAEEVARETYRIWNAPADISQLQPPYGEMARIVEVNKRLKGLVG